MLINQTEYLKTAGNLSDLNQVYLGFHKGLQYSVLGPIHTPDNLDFQATSYGSHTECRMVTTQCGAVSNYGANSYSFYNSDFACNNTVAGLNMTGSFSDLGRPKQTLPKNISSTMFQNVNTMSPSVFAFGFQYFNDSAKREQVPSINLWGLSDAEYGPITNTTNQYFWALAFSLGIIPPDIATHNRNPWGQLNVAATNRGGAEGIMSCQTNVSEIVRLAQPRFTTFSPRPYLHLPALPPFNQTHTNVPISPFRPITCPNPPLPSSPPPHPAPTPPSLSSTASPAPGATNSSNQGLQQSFVHANTPEDLESLFATVYDQTLVSIPAGVLHALPVINATQRVQTQVARVPKAPFVCLLLLNLLYAGVGIVLTATALAAVGFGGTRTGPGGIGRGVGVRDAQARLSVAAIVAESFEAPNLGEDARSVDDLSAERRGRLTRRVALGTGPGGGRRFRQVIVAGEKGEGDSVGLVSGEFG